MKNRNKTTIAKYIEQRGIVRSFIAKKIGVSYPRFRTILQGAHPYLHEAVKLSQTLNAPISDLFPHLFQEQSTNQQTDSHE